MRRIVVAEMPIDIQMEDVAFFDKRFAAYLSENDAPAQLRITSRTAPQIIPPVGEQIMKVRNTTVLRMEDGRYCHVQYDPKREIYYQMCVYRPDFSESDIQLAIPKEDSGLTDADFEHAYIGFDFASRLGVLGGAVLHGSAIAYKGRGVIFSAPSGTGKSTHTGFWKQCFGEDVIFVNDDKPALRFEQEAVYMYGTPWSGKTDLNTNIRVPLHAVVFVERGEKNAVRRLALTESIYYLQSQVIQPYHDAKVGSALIDRMIEVATRVPVYMLTCNMDPEAAYVARAAVFADDGKEVVV